MLTVLIATSGRPSLLRQTLQSLLQSDIGPGSIRIIVVENGGKNGAETIVESMQGAGSVVYVYCEEANKSSALNVGLRHCGDGLVFMTDDDVVVDRRVLSIYRDAAEEKGEGHFFGGTTVASYETPPPEWLKRLLPVSALGLSRDMLARELSFLGFNWAAFRSDLERAGGFNPLVGPGGRSGATGQETEMQRRLIRMGCRPVPLYDAVVTHVVPASRCNAQWAIHRSFRAGVYLGLEANAEGRAAVMRKHMRLVYMRCRLWAARAIVRTEYRKVAYEYWDARLQGFRHGVKYSRSQQEGNGRSGPVM